MNFDEFKKVFKGDIASPADGDSFTKSLSRWATNAEKKPKYVVYPVDAQDISNAIKFTVKSKCFPLAIAGGRHSTSGASSSEGGMVIDMRNIKGVRLDKDNMIAYVGGGTTVREVAAQTLSSGLATTVGLCGDVGIAGFVSGGGFGFSLGEHGLGLDNLVSAKVVLANGEIVPANEKENPDLFWGIRGGGSNFGVLAELGMRLHKQRNTFYHMEYSFQKAELGALIAELNRYLGVQKPQESVYLAFMPYAPHIYLSGYGNLDPDAGNPWKGFNAVDHKSGVVEPKEEFKRLVTLSDAFCRMKGAKTWRGAYINKLDFETVSKVFDEYLVLLKTAKSSRVIYEFYSYEKMASVPKGDTAYPHRTTDKTVMVLAAEYTEPTSKMEAAVENLAKLVSSSSTKSAQDSLGYPNYADMYAKRNVTEEYAVKLFGTEKYQKLQKVKQAYDRDMVFEQWFSILPDYST